jgi:uncharacterized integral membrane protein
MKARSAVILVLVVLAAIIVIQNSQLAALSLFFWRIYAPQFILVVILFFLGFGVGWLAGRRGRREREAKSVPPSPPAMPPAHAARPSPPEAKS